MNAPEVMQMAADHAAKAEEFMVQGQPQQARLHVEQSKLLVSMAREVRIGNNRANAYRDLVFKPVVIAEPMHALDPGVTADGVREFDEDFAVSSTSNPLEHDSPVPAQDVPVASELGGSEPQ